MVRRDLVAAKTARARARLNDAAALFSKPEEQFVSDAPTRDLALFYLFLAVQECSDLAAHWVADETPASRASPRVRTGDCLRDAVHMAAHDLTHLHQLSRVLAYPYRAAVGPWQAYLGVLHCAGHSAK